MAIQNQTIVPSDADRTTMSEVTNHDITFTAVNTTTSSTPASKPGIKKKKGAKPKLSAKEKKERNVNIWSLFIYLIGY